MATDLLAYYRKVVDEYRRLLTELAGVQVQEIHHRKLMWEQSTQTSASGLAYEGDMMTSDIRVDVLELQYKIRALDAEITWCRDMLSEGITDMKWGQS